MRSLGIILICVLVYNCHTLKAQEREKCKDVSLILKASPVFTKLSIVNTEYSRRSTREVLRRTNSPVGVGYHVALEADIRMSGKLYYNAEYRKAKWNVKINYADDVYLASQKETYSCWDAIPVGLKYIIPYGANHFFLGAGFGLNHVNRYLFHKEFEAKGQPQYKQTTDISTDHKDAAFIAISAGAYIALSKRLDLVASAEYDQNIRSISYLELDDGSGLGAFVNAPYVYNLLGINLGVKYSIIK